MENKQSPSKKKLISIQEERLIREVNYDYLAAGPTKPFKKPLLLDLEIFKKNTASRQGSQRVLVSIKSRAPAIKTLYIAEKSRFSYRKGSSKSGSRLAIGDHSSFTTYLSEDVSNVTSIACGTETSKVKRESERSLLTIVEQRSTFVSRCPHGNLPPSNIYNDNTTHTEKCFLYTQPQLNIPKLEAKADTSKSPNKVDIATLVATNTSSECSMAPISKTVEKLHKRISHLEHKILRQEMVFRCLDPDIDLSSSDEEARENMKSSSGIGRPGCSYIQQYSHVPETSAFQRYAHQAAPLSRSKATTIEKEHNSEQQYGRDFTAYDGITARGRRQCASVPCKRDDIPKLAAERVHKIRHKLNPVRDYRLMDTVHYLAQGEFAPRDDGIKLTLSREAVLSDIIWEDVCRTHWPNTRLGRRMAHSERERCGTRCELQRLIDSLLRERVAHVERRRRRHYRIVKLNHRHENCKPVGKTGDIIVASHKNRPGSEETTSDINATRVPGSSRQSERHARRSHRSHGQLEISDVRPRHRLMQDDCSPGPSYVSRREPTCCYQTSTKPEASNSETRSTNQCAVSINHDLTSGTSCSTCKSQAKNHRLVLKKDTSRRKHLKDEPDLEHYIVLPTLVMRTPSNVKRQKKFNELYHRILNTQTNEAHSELTSEDTEPPAQEPAQKDIGFNINITLTNSNEAHSELTSEDTEPPAQEPAQKDIGFNINITLTNSNEGLPKSSK